MAATGHLTPASVKQNKNLKGCLWKQRTHKITRIGGSVLLSVFIYSYVVLQGCIGTPHLLSLA